MKVTVSRRMYSFVPHTVQMCKYKGILECSRIFTVRNEVAKVMFLHLSVCPQGGLPPCMLGYHHHHPYSVTRHPPGPDQIPKEQTPPMEGSPSVHAGIPPPRPPSGTRHPSGTRPDPPRSSPPREQAPPSPPGPDTPLQQTATVAHGTHPSGMHFVKGTNATSISVSGQCWSIAVNTPNVKRQC